MQHLIAPYHGDLVNPVVTDTRVAELKEASLDWPSWDLTPHQVADLELLMNGGLSPLSAFMDREDVESVCRDMRLANGVLWPVPVKPGYFTVPADPAQGSARPPSSGRQRPVSGRVNPHRHRPARRGYADP